MKRKRRIYKENSYLIQALEYIGILREDGHMTMRDIAKCGGLSERTLRSWCSGNVTKITRQSAEALERILLDPGHGPRLVPWSESHFGMADLMWQTAQRGGQEAVTKSLAAEYKRCSSHTRSAVKRDLDRARASPNGAQDVDSDIYRVGAAKMVAREFGHYASHMQNHFISRGFPEPGLATPENWTSVLLLIQYFRDTASAVAPNPELLKDLRAWLSTGCKSHSSSAWSLILRFRLTEEQLIAAWEQVQTTPEECRELLDKLSWFDDVNRYTGIVKGNFTVARNALATASAARYRQYYHPWHTVLVKDPDSGWKSPQRLRDLGYLDENFDDFLNWFREAGNGRAANTTSLNPDDPNPVL